MIAVFLEHCWEWDVPFIQISCRLQTGPFSFQGVPSYIMIGISIVTPRTALKGVTMPSSDEEHMIVRNFHPELHNLPNREMMWRTATYFLTSGMKLPIHHLALLYAMESCKEDANVDAAREGPFTAHVFAMHCGGKEEEVL